MHPITKTSKKMKPRLYPSFLLASLLAISSACAGAADEPGVIKFSDSSKPGTLKINLGRGELQITGTDSADVTVKSETKPITNKPRKDGLRELTSATAGYSLKEKDNLMTLDATAHDWGRGSGDFKLTVPRHTNIIIQNAWGGDITCSGVSGDLEINSMHGEIKLDSVAGGAVVSTMNGEIRANIRELHDGKPLSFTSMNGEVVLRVPADAKANVRLRTQHGSVLTDFEESALVTKTEPSPGMPRVSRASSIRGRQVITTEVQDAIREAAHVGATAVKEALEAVKEGLEAAKLDSEQARQDLEKAKRDLQRDHVEVERERTRTARAPRAGEAMPAMPAPPKPPAAPLPPRTPIPTVSGGKLVTGTLNGGGPEISVSTMNGDVVLRKQ